MLRYRIGRGKKPETIVVLLRQVNFEVTEIAPFFAREDSLKRISITKCFLGLEFRTLDQMPTFSNSIGTGHSVLGKQICHKSNAFLSSQQLLIFYIRNVSYITHPQSFQEKSPIANHYLCCFFFLTKAVPSAHIQLPDSKDGACGQVFQVVYLYTLLSSTCGAV